MLNNRVGVNGDKKEVNNDDEVGTIRSNVDDRCFAFIACLLGRDAGWEKNESVSLFLLFSRKIRLYTALGQTDRDKLSGMLDGPKEVKRF